MDARPSRNMLLAALPPAAFDRLEPHLQSVALPRREMLTPSGEAITHAWFPDAGVASTVAISPDGERVEAGLFGYDGMSGVPLLLDAETTPTETFMQVEGHGRRIEAGALLAALDDTPALRTPLLRFVAAQLTQLAHTTLANAVHSLPERLARWLLMCHDRVERDAIALTHEFMALMLGVRRAGVTTALHVLEGGRLIRATRGLVTIRDRAALQDFAADAYGVPEAEYARLIAPLSKGGARPPG